MAPPSGVFRHYFMVSSFGTKKNTCERDLLLEMKKKTCCFVLTSLLASFVPLRTSRWAGLGVSICICKSVVFPTHWNVPVYRDVSFYLIAIVLTMCNKNILSGNFLYDTFPGVPSFSITLSASPFFISFYFGVAWKLVDCLWIQGTSCLSCNSFVVDVDSRKSPLLQTSRKLKNLFVNIVVWISRQNTPYLY